MATPGAVPSLTDKWSYIIEQIEAKRKEDETRAWERAQKVWQIDSYLANSPMRGLGECIVANAERTGVNPYLAPAVAQAESSLGAACMAPHNCWGWLARRSGFPDWQTSISEWFTFVVNTWGVVQSSRQMSGYC